MAIAHDMTVVGRLIALLDRCQMHNARGDFRHMPDLATLTEQCARIVHGSTKAQMDAKVIDFQPPRPTFPDEMPQ
jgi:hypothetical protein